MELFHYVKLNWMESSKMWLSKNLSN